MKKVAKTHAELATVKDMEKIGIEQVAVKIETLESRRRN